MKYTPILFSGPMVRAILEGRKNIKRMYVRRGASRDAPEHLARRLANGVEICDKTGCWEWQRAHNGLGYGTLTVNGRTVYAHRLSYVLGVGGIQRGEFVLHKCDNPRCINPDHLYLGNQSCNMKDCYIRGRSRIPKVRLFGERNGASKLTEADVRAIRLRVAAGERQHVLATEFGVSQSQISNIKRGVQW